MSGIWERSFSTVTDGERYFAVAKVDEKTAHRVAELIRDGERGDALAAIVADALNLHAMPKLIARAGL